MKESIRTMLSQTLLYLSFVICYRAIGSTSKDVPPGLTGHEKLLFQNLTTGYNSISRPVRDASTQVQMTFGVSINQILDLEEKHQILSSYVWIYEKWSDENLKWFPDDFNGLKQLMFPAIHIWVPDIYIFNVAGSSLDGFLDLTRSFVVVQFDGQVQWSVPLLIKSACPVDATYFPYDKQTCEIHFGSWIYDLSQIDINLDPVKPDLSHYVINNEFDLESTSLEKDLMNSSCCPGEGEHPMVHLTLRLKRKTLYYDYIVIAPTINLCVMTLATFLLPCECGWKIAIGLNVFLTLYVLQLLIAENVPDTNSTPLISVFLLLVMSLNCVSLIMATVVMNIKKRSKIEPVPKVPPLLLNICENYLSKIVCTRLFDWKRIATVPKETLSTIGPFLVNDDNNYQSQNGDQYHYVQLHDLRSFRQSYKNLRSKHIHGKIQSTKKHCIGRTETAESTLSSSSTNDAFIKEVSSTDKLIKRESVQYAKHSPNVNHSCITKDEDTDGDTMSEQYNEDNSSDTPVANTEHNLQKYPRNRPSYKCAIRKGSYAPAKNVTKHRNFGARSIKRQSVFSGLDMKYQWYFVADVIDTTAFLIYIIIMFVGIMTVLVIVPIYA